MDFLPVRRHRGGNFQFHGGNRRKVDWRLLLSGLVGLAIAAIVLFRPLTSIGLLSIFVAAWFIATGLSALLSAIEYRKVVRDEWVPAIAGVLAILSGLYVFARPILAVALLPILIGSYTLLWGVLLLVASFRLWRRGGARTVR